MDKYEYRVKTEQMLEYVQEKSYRKAMEIADTIDWRNVKNTSMLSTVSEIYENTGEFDKARDILFIAYDRAPSSRKIVYRLGLLSLKTNQIDEAMDCYEEFVKMAPKDPNQHILRYKILKAQKAPLEQQIDALEEFKHSEYVEKWAYELARLYHEAGMTSECLEECDDLILWFSEGKYVYQAMELKMKYKPLTPLQQEKYENRTGEGAAPVRKKPLFKKPKERPAPDPRISQKIRENVHVTGSIDLPELPEPMADIIEPDLESLPDERPQSVRPRTKIQNTSEIAMTITGASLADVLKTGVAVASGVDMGVPAPVQEDSQITGQMRIEEILSNWEVTQKENARIIEQNQAELERRKAEQKEEEAALEDTKTILPDDIRRLMEDIENGVEASPDLSVSAESDIDDDVEDDDDVVENMGALVETLHLSDDDDEYDDSEEYADEDEYDDSEEYEDEDEYDDSEEYEDEDEYDDSEEYEDEDEYDDSEEYEDEDEYDDSEEYEDEDEYDDSEEYEDEDEYDDSEEYEDEDEYDDSEEYEDEDEYDDSEEYEDEDEYDDSEEYEDEYDDSEEYEDEDEYDDSEEYEDEYSDSEENEDEEDYADFEDFDDDDEYDDSDEYTEEDDEYFERIPQIDLDDLDDSDDEDFSLDDIFAEADSEEDDLDLEELEEPEMEEPEEAEPEEPEPIEPEPEVLPRRRKRKPVKPEPQLEIEEEEVLEIEEPSEEEITARMNKFDTGFVVQGRYDLSATSEIGLKAGLTEEQKKLFSYFVPIRGVSEQIVEVLDNDKRCKNRFGTSRIGNILVVGRKGSGKTVLAVDIVKAIQKQRRLKQGKVAIVTGESLNKKELEGIISKLNGGALIIEKAAKMNNRTIRELNDLMEEQTGELLFVLEEQRKPLERMLAANPNFKKKFTSRLELPIFINDELVTFGQTYAKENGYRIDEMGILALYSRIDMMQREDHAVTVAEVKEIMDTAIDHSQKANVKHLMKRVFGKSTDESDRIILKEEDFKL